MLSYLHILDNVALRKTTTVKSERADGLGQYAIDGNPDATFTHRSCFHADNSVVDPWWSVDLDGHYDIWEIAITNRATSRRFGI